MRYDHTYYFHVAADPNLHQIQVRSFSPQTDNGNISTIVQDGDSGPMFTNYLAWNGSGQVVSTNSASGSFPPISIRELPLSRPSMELCHSLQPGS